MLDQVVGWVFVLGVYVLPLASIVLGVVFLVRGVRTRRMEFVLWGVLLALALPAFALMPVWMSLTRAVREILDHLWGSGPLQ